MLSHPAVAYTHAELCQHRCFFCCCCCRTLLALVVRTASCGSFVPFTATCGRSTQPLLLPAAAEPNEEDIMDLRPKDHVAVSTARLDLGNVAAMVSDPRAGATSTFSGTTRDNHYGELQGCASMVSRSAGLQSCNNKEKARVCIRKPPCTPYFVHKRLDYSEHSCCHPEPAISSLCPTAVSEDAVHSRAPAGVGSLPSPQGSNARFYRMYNI